MSDPIIHLLIPKEYRVWCLPNKVPNALSFTKLPSVATCCNCLTAFRVKTSGNHRPFRMLHTPRKTK